MVGWNVMPHYNVVSTTNALGTLLSVGIACVLYLYVRWYLRKHYVHRSELALLGGTPSPRIYIKAKTMAPGLDITARALGLVNPPVSDMTKAAAMGGSDTAGEKEY